MPATTSLERNDIGVAGRDSFLMKMEKAIEPLAESKDDYIIFQSSRCLGCEELSLRDVMRRNGYDFCMIHVERVLSTMKSYARFRHVLGGFYRILIATQSTLLQEFRADPIKAKLRPSERSNFLVRGLRDTGMMTVHPTQPGRACGVAGFGES